MTFSPDAPSLKAWRSGNRERISLRSPSKYVRSDSVAISFLPVYLSETILPSFISTIRSAYSSAKSRSWETTITSFCSESFFKVSKTSFPVSESSEPVGSSANMILGSLTNALASATRCFCPPERVLACVSRSLPIQTFLKLLRYFRGCVFRTMLLNILYHMAIKNSTAGFLTVLALFGY